MLENNSNKLMATAAAIVVAGAIFGTVNAAYPQAANAIIEKVENVTNAEDYAKLDYTYNESDKTAVVTGFKEGQSNKDLVIPKTTEKDGVTYKVVSIGDYAFKNRGLTSVIIPNTITSIGRSGFSDNKLTSVTIPNTVTNIGYAIFSGNKLTSVTIPNTVKSIDAFAFYNNNLTSVTIPSSVESIGISAFGYNNKLTLVTVPSTVTSLDGKTFDPSVVINRK